MTDVQKETTIINRIVKTPMRDLTFTDFATLRSGRDRFSTTRFAELRAGVLPNEYARVKLAFPKRRELKSCLRWMLRGLPIDKAIRKVAVDRAIQSNCRRANTT